MSRGDLKIPRISDEPSEIGPMLAPYKRLPPMFRNKNLFDIAQRGFEKQQIEEKLKTVQDDSFSAGYDQGLHYGRKEGWDASGEPHRIKGYNKGFVDASRLLIEGDNHMIITKGDFKHIVKGRKLDNLIANLPRDPDGVPLPQYKIFQPDNDGLYGYTRNQLYNKNSAWIASEDMMYLDIKNMRRAAQNNRGAIKGKIIPEKRPLRGGIQSTPADIDIIMESLLPDVTKTKFTNYKFPRTPKIRERALLEYKKGK